MADKEISEALFKRIQAEVIDGLDEELELERDDSEHTATGEVRHTPGDRAARLHYFRELLRLQVELVRLQDWIVAKQKKVVVLFEGRDASGKGGVIKRVTQPLNPRVCRVAALPAPNDREKTQWYFQRYVAH